MISVENNISYNRRYGNNLMMDSYNSDSDALDSSADILNKTLRENALCMDFIKNHKRYNQDYFEEEADLNKQINLNLSLNRGKKISIRKPFAPLIVNSNSNQTTNIPLESTNTKNVLNRDKQCNNMNFERKEDLIRPPMLCESPILHQRYGRKLVMSKSIDTLSNKSDLSTIEELTVLQPIKPTTRPNNDLPTCPLRNLPDIKRPLLAKPPMVKRHSFPPESPPRCKSTLPEKCNTILPLVDIPASSLKPNMRYREESPLFADTYSDDDFDSVSDDEDDDEEIIVRKQMSNNEKIHRFLDCIENSAEEA